MIVQQRPVFRSFRTVRAARAAAFRLALLASGSAVFALLHH
jgi:fructose-1,6-bisphosphatase/inositol monophosphatase family enzyme